MKCDICLKRKCAKHPELNDCIYYDKGQVKLSAAGIRRYGEDYLEKLRCTKQYPVNLKIVSGAETKSRQQPIDGTLHVPSVSGRPNPSVKNSSDTAKLEMKMDSIGIELKNLTTLLQQVLNRWDKRDDEMYFEVEILKTKVKLIENDKTNTTT